MSDDKEVRDALIELIGKAGGNTEAEARQALKDIVDTVVWSDGFIAACNRYLPAMSEDAAVAEAGDAFRASRLEHRLRKSGVL